MKKILRTILASIMTIIVAFTFSGCGLFDWLRSFDKPETPIYNLNPETPKSARLVFPQGKYIAVGDGSYTDCVLVINDGKLNANAYEVSWKLNGEEVGTGGKYAIRPSDKAGVNQISATFSYEEEINSVKTTKSLSATAKFVYYDQLVQTATVQSQTIDGKAVYEMQGVDSENCLVEWFVNDELSGDGTVFTLKENKVGAYEVSAKVNGISVQIPNDKVAISGSEIVNGLSVDYDSDFPTIKVKWNEQGESSYKIRITTTRETKYYSATKNEYDFTLSQLPLDYHSVAISVKSLGDGEIYQESEYCEDLVIPALNSTQVQYLNTNYGIDNAYITSDAEFFRQFDYMLITRKQPTDGDTETKRTFYMGYDYKAGGRNLSGMVEVAFDRSGYAGFYSLGSSEKNGIATITIVFKSESVPTLPALGEKPISYSKNLNGYRPAISESGMSSDEFEIDTKKGVEVENTDALYRVAEWGYRPIPKQGSRAEVYYERARQVLKSITDESMSEYETVLAIYDYIMYVNNYNNDVVSLETAKAVISPAFYVEGVLTPNYGYAVCDGIAKTFSLLCNIKGIECVRVTGEAGNNGKLGAHAWNKVKVDGEWYVVDATWGDLVFAMEYKTGIFKQTKSASFELGLHSFFLVSDSDVATNHIETDGGYPTTAPVAYNHYERQTISALGKVYDMYINEQNGALIAQTSAIAQLISSTVWGKNSFSVLGENIVSDFYLFEIKYHAQNELEIKQCFSQSGIIAREIKSGGANYLFHKSGNTIIIIVSTSLILANNSL